MKTFPIATTVNYSFVNETYSRVKFDINTIITFRGSHCGKQGFHINTCNGLAWDSVGAFTREQRLENYIFHTLEQGLRPFCYTDEQWTQYHHDMRSELHSEMCEAKSSYYFV